MFKNKVVVPEAKAALDKFKMQAASEVGVNLQNGYNGDLTSRQTGSIDGQMVNNMNPVRTMRFERHNRISQGHKNHLRTARRYIPRGKRQPRSRCGASRTEANRQIRTAAPRLSQETPSRKVLRPAR